jgi:hypothetical protein
MHSLLTSAQTVVVFEFCCVNVNAFIYTGLYYKPITIVSDDSRVVNKIETSLTDDARVVVYDYHMFIVIGHLSL